MKVVKLDRSFVLEYKNKFWVRKDTRGGFDIPIGAFAFGSG